MRITRRLRREEGSVAITGLLLATALVMLIGTGVDIAHAFILRNDLNGIAKTAALAGSQQLDLNAWRQGTLALDPQQAQHAADQEIAANAQVNGTTTSTTTAITVRVQEAFSTLMLRLVGMPNLTVTASATAAPETPGTS